MAPMNANQGLVCTMSGSIFFYSIGEKKGISYRTIINNPGNSNTLH